MIREEKRVKTLIVVLVVFSFLAGATFGMMFAMQHVDGLKAEIEMVAAKERRAVVDEVEILSIQLRSFREAEERFEDAVCSSMEIVIPQPVVEKKVRPTPTPTPHP